MIVAIDPGITGAIAWFGDDGQLVTVDDMPVDKIKVGKTMRSRINPGRLLNRFSGLGASDTVVLEEVHAQGRNGSLANFSLGRSYGVIECALANRDGAFLTVKPRVWKKALGLTSDKKQSLALARTTWPDHPHFNRAKDDGRAEAALIGHWYLTHKETPHP